MKASSDELKVFVSVVESGSFSRAAEQLKMANSAVSRTVKKLESKLGIALLTRTTRQLALTQEGERYFRHVQRFLQEMTTAESDLIESLQAPKGLLRVDAATPVILHLLMPMIKPFRLRYPDVTLSLISSESFINLIERKVDIAIRAGNLTDSTLRARLLFRSFRKMVASPAYLREHGHRKRWLSWITTTVSALMIPHDSIAGPSPVKAANSMILAGLSPLTAERRLSSSVLPVMVLPACRTI